MHISFLFMRNCVVRNFGLDMMMMMVMIMHALLIYVSISPNLELLHRIRVVYV
jgi:hypothetical protein